MYNVGEGHICQDVCVEPEDSSVEVALSFSFYVGSRDKTQPIRPMRQASKHFCPLSHLPVLDLLFMTRSLLIKLVWSLRGCNMQAHQVTAPPKVNPAVASRKGVP